MFPANMQLNLERPDYTCFLRAADGQSALVDERTLIESFIIAPDNLIEHWPVRDASLLTAENLAPILALKPEVVVLGTGPRQVFPPAAAMAACLSQGIGIDVMTNAAAARTYNVLAGEGRKVAAGFIFS